MNWLHQVTKKITPLKKEKFLLAISGGLDSTALFYVFDHLKKHFQLSFSVAYFHHGPSSNVLQLDYRFKAFKVVEKLCLNHGVEFFSNYAGQNPQTFLQDWSQELSSEAKYRQARQIFFDSLMLDHGFSRLVLAHHSSDLLETRLLRMIRGVGPQGLTAMVFDDGKKLRPFLTVSREELAFYVKEKQGAWLDDPSNKDLLPLRNWLREKWLKDLHKKQPGALKALSRSLDLLLRETDRPTFITDCLEGKSVNLSELLCLNLDQKKQVLATYMKSQGLKNYGLSHINEVLKRLDTEKKSHTFHLLGHRWTVDAGRMGVQELKLN